MSKLTEGKQLSNTKHYTGDIKKEPAAPPSPTPKSYDPNNGKFDNIDEFMDRDLFEDSEERVVYNDKAEFSRRDVELIAEQAAAKAVREFSDTFYSYLTEEMNEQMEHYINSDYISHLGTIRAIRPVLIALMESDNGICPEKENEIMTKFDTLNKIFKNKIKKYEK